MDQELSIGELSERSGVSASALRFYEAEGLLGAERTASGHRRYHREVLRRVAFIRVAQQVGLSLGEIRAALDTLPDGRTPTKADWARLSARWQPRLDDQIRQLARMRDRLTACIGCGCLSLKLCKLVNPDDRVAVRGPGPRYVIDDDEDDDAEDLDVPA
ncbi:MAG TPA: redox-sensitive transcriptional activator SoxR [Aquihabitans sp.]|nr:redox-sensitive transcriptional activator SoxR [Aquihabitans sp.]